MGLLGILALVFEGTWLVESVIFAIHLADDLPGFAGGLLRQGDRVGTHVGDQTEAAFADINALVEFLGGRHGFARRETELTVGFLLQGAGCERCGRVTLTFLLLDLGDAELGLRQVGHNGIGIGLATDGELVEFFTVLTMQLCAKARSGGICQQGFDGPVLSRFEGLNFTFALADQAQGDRLDAAS